MSLPWLKADPHWFPPTQTAMAEPNGLLAAGGDLSPPRLLTAYQKGIFPWYSEGQPILWWSPNPRVVFLPDKIHISSSMKKFMRKCAWQIRINTAFTQILAQCAAPRRNSNGTWLLSDMQQAYTTLHKMGFAHSIEVWEENELVGGLYGIALGRIFFGESMFSCAPNGSKVALIALGALLKSAEFALIDCQVGNPHLSSMGAVTLARLEFEAILRQNTTLPPTPWPTWSSMSLSCEHFIQP